MTGDSIETVEVARRLLRSASTASLATLDADGAPFATLVTMATDHDGAPLTLLSRLAVHTANIHRDARASLLVAPTAGDDNALAGARLTLSGRFVRLDEDDPGRPAAMERFLARHPEAVDYAAFTDFALYRLVLDAGHFVGGFGRISRLPASRLIVEPARAQAFVEASADVLDHLNNAMAAYLSGLAMRQLGRAPGPWRAVAIDADGLDLRNDVVLRLPFRARLASPQLLVAELEALIAATHAG